MRVCAGNCWPYPLDRRWVSRFHRRDKISTGREHYLYPKRVCGIKILKGDNFSLLNVDGAAKELLSMI